MTSSLHPPASPATSWIIPTPLCRRLLWWFSESLCTGETNLYAFVPWPQADMLGKLVLGMPLIITSFSILPNHCLQVSLLPWNRLIQSGQCTGLCSLLCDAVQPHSLRSRVSGCTTQKVPSLLQHIGFDPGTAYWNPGRAETRRGIERLCLAILQIVVVLCHPSPQATLRKPTWSFLTRRKSPHPRWRGELRDFRAFFCTMAQPFLERSTGLDALGP